MMIAKLAATIKSAATNNEERPPPMIVPSVLIALAILCIVFGCAMLV